MLLLAQLGACARSQDGPGLKLEDAWVRLPPPGAEMTAAYGRLSNTGSAVVEIVGFASDGFEAVSLHSTTMQNGVSRMRSLPGWTLIPEGTLLLQPGGHHLMLKGPLLTLAEGEEIHLEIITRGGDVYRFALPVMAR